MVSGPSTGPTTGPTTGPSTGPTGHAAAAGRNAGLDTLRAATTLLVVLHHTAITYGAQGGWFYREVAPDAGLSSLLLTAFCTVNQAWFMGLFFLLAGYYTTPTLARKGGLGFLRGRLLRLGLPWLVFVLLIGPLTVVLPPWWQGKPMWPVLLALAQRGAFIPGPLWFVQVLLVFCGLAVLAWPLWRRFALAPVDAAAAAFPSSRSLAWAALGTGLLAFVLRLQWPVGSSVWGVQPGYLASYAVLYAAGCVAAGPRWLQQLPAARVQHWRRVARWALPVLPLVVLGGAGLPLLRGRPEGGVNLPALVYALWEPLVAWGVLLRLLQGFQRRFAAPGPVWRRLSRHAFLIFVIHPPVLVLLALLCSALPLPPLLKFVLTGAMACVLCDLLAGLLLRLPGVARVF